MLDRDDIAYLRNLHENGGMTWGEAAFLEDAFALIDPATLPDLPENATHGDMLDELEARV